MNSSEKWFYNFWLGQELGIRLNGDFVSGTDWHSLPGLTHSYGQILLIEAVNRITHTSPGTRMAAMVYGHAGTEVEEGYGYQAGFTGIIYFFLCFI